MKHTIVSSKDLDIKCWSALRYLDECNNCNRVQKCELPEGKKGQIKLLTKQILETKEKLSGLQEQRNELNYKLKRGQHE